MHTRPRRLVVLTLPVALAVVLAGCGATTSSADPAPSATPVASGPPASAPAPTDGPSQPPQTTQTDTAWGRIWDDLPPGFPVFPGATIADDATAEPVSAAFAIPDADPTEVAAWMQAALETATYSTEALSGPFEDGSVTLDSVGDGDCRIETVVVPAGGLTLMTIRYGAACPNS